MAVKPIAYAYWRSIKRGARTFASIPESVKDDVRMLAYEEVEAGTLTAEEYARYIGEAFA